MDDVEVRYTHYRPYKLAYRDYGRKGKPKAKDLHRYAQGVGFLGDEAKKYRIIPHPRGGLTVCEVSFGDTKAIGESICSLSDQFCYRTGRQIALGRAKKNLSKYLQESE